MHFYTVPGVHYLLFRLTPSWRTIGHIGKSRVVQLTSLAPFLGYLLVFNTHAMSFFTSVAEHAGFITSTLEPDVLVSTIKVYYVALMLIGIASILYTLFCPTEIRSYTDERDFIDSVEKLVTVPYILERLSSLTHSALREIPAIYPYINDINADRLRIMHRDSVASQDGYAPMARRDWVSKNSNEITRILTAFYAAQNVRWWFLRVLISVMYVYGFVRLASPSYIIFMRVITQ